MPESMPASQARSARLDRDLGIGQPSRLGVLPLAMLRMFRELIATPPRFRVPEEHLCGSAAPTRLRKRRSCSLLGESDRDDPYVYCARAIRRPLTLKAIISNGQRASGAVQGVKIAAAL